MVTDLGQHWSVLLPVKHQAITWTNVDLSSQVFYGVNLIAIWQKVFKVMIHKMSFSGTLSKLQLHLSGASEFNMLSQDSF